MTQYRWQPVFKFVPTDGIEEVLVVSECFSDTSGFRLADPDHMPEITQKVDVNRQGSQRAWGLRPRVKCTLEIVDTATQAYLALIINRLVANEVWTTYLSLDGGLTYRQVELKSYDGPKAIEGKTFAGAIYTLELQAVALLDQMPNLGTGVW